jgi:Spy/CpxP family protein refolding chaperone
MKHIAALLITLTLTSVAIAQPGQHARGAGGAGFGRGGFGDVPTSKVVEMMTQRLDLTPEQKTQVEQIVDRTRGAVKQHSDAIRTEMEKSRDEILAVLTPEQKEKFKEERQQLMQGLGGFLADRGPELKEAATGAGDEIRLRIAMQSLDLTQEQRTKLKEVSEKFREQRKALDAQSQPKLQELRKQIKSEIDTILTAEQREQLEQRIKEMPRPGKDSAGKGALQGRRGPGGPGSRGAGNRPGQANE